METCDVLIVGGGPAGSTCAWKLRQAGLDVLVVDKALFPREKLCAGWVTPLVFQERGIDPAEYARGRVLQPITGFSVGLIGSSPIPADYGRPISFGVRRCEFDHYLLEQAGARRQLGEPVRTLRRDGVDWVVNERWRAPLVVGAGGHFCPVARLLGSDGAKGDARAPLLATQEIEFCLSPRQRAECPVDPRMPEVYFCEDFQGYGWCVRKGDYLNVGLGREDRRRLPEHTASFCDFLKRQGRVPADLPEKLRGHAYLCYDRSPRKLLDDGVLLVGDAAGMAYAQSGEGIRPAVESGLMAASVIAAAGGAYRREQLEPYRQLLRARFGARGRGGVPFSLVPAGLRWLIARKLLGSRWFVRRVLLERWFLRTHQGPWEEGRGPWEGGRGTQGVTACSRTPNPEP